MTALIFCFFVLVVCSYCNKDFKSRGRHSWRCKEWLRVVVNDWRDDTMLADTSNHDLAHSNARLNDAVLRDQGRISNTEYVECCCGKKCKGVQGLKAHQRSCRFVRGMCSDLLLPSEGEIINDYDQTSDFDEGMFDNTPNLKPGIKLPKTELEWKEADLYFRAELPVLEVKETSINYCVTKMTNLVYDYLHKITVL